MKNLISPMLLIAGLAACTSGDVILDEPQASYVQDVSTGFIRIEHEIGRDLLHQRLFLVGELAEAFVKSRC